MGPWETDTDLGHHQTPSSPTRYLVQLFVFSLEVEPPLLFKILWSFIKNLCYILIVAINSNIKFYFLECRVFLDLDF